MAQRTRKRPRSAKTAVIEMIRRMPESSSVADIAAELYVRQAADEGLRQLDEGLGIPHDQVKKKLAKWLS